MTIELSQLQNQIAFHRDEIAYRQLFIYFHKPAVRFAVSIMQNEEGADELYSDAMMKLWLMDCKLCEVANLKTYLFTMLRNAAFNYLKRQKRINIVSIDQIQDDEIQFENSPEQNHILNEFKSTVQRAVNQLPPKCRLVYQLIKEQECSYKEAALILNISVNTIEGHMTTALKKLTQALLKEY